MNSFPQLETKRLLLDQIKPFDIPEIVRYAGNKKIADTTRTMPHPYFEEDAIAWMNMANQGFKKKDKFIFAIRAKEDKRLRGGIGLDIDIDNNRAELGYWIAEKFWNMGFTTEAVGELLRFGFEKLQLNKIVATYVDSNIASGKIMEKNGMIKEGEFVDHDIKYGQYITLIQYRMLQSEFKKLS